MVFQYQYQYQYQLQRGLGLTTYDSFTSILRDTYSNPVLLSFLVALLPLVYFFLRDRLSKTVLYQNLDSLYQTRKNERKVKHAREIFEETFQKKKKSPLPTFLLIGATLLLGGLIFTNSLFFVAVTSNSMAPVFWNGDLVLVQSLSKDYQKGDIVVFENQQVKFEDKIIHRIDSKVGDRIITKGDNNNFPDDDVIFEENILASGVSFNGRPVVAKRVGSYFIKNYDIKNDPFREQDPTIKFLRRSVSNVHAYGPLYIVIILLLMLLTILQKPERGKVY
jgi:signal peptidase I